MNRSRQSLLHLATGLVKQGDLKRPRNISLSLFLAAKGVFLC